MVQTLLISSLLASGVIASVGDERTRACLGQFTGQEGEQDARNLVRAPQEAPYEVVIEKAPFPGFLFRPKTDKPMPGIVMLHGSEGGNGDFWQFPGERIENTGIRSITAQTAYYYASQGVVSYALCYFDCGHQPGYENYPPDELVGVDLVEVTYKAYRWLKSSDFVQGRKVALLGGSRGAEQALLLGSLVGLQKNKSYIPFDAIISLFPSDFVAPSFSKADAAAIMSGRAMPRESLPAWKFAGQTIPTRDPIQVEADPAPTLIFYGSHDNIWGPSVKPYNLVLRYQQHGIPYYFTRFKNSQDPMQTASEIEARFAATPKIVVNLEDEGHFPQGVSSSQLMYRVIYQFMLAHLRK